MGQKRETKVAARGFAGHDYTRSTNWTREERLRRVARLRGLARLLDTAVRLPNGFRLGADSLIGLVPGVGDAMTTLIAAYFVYAGYQLGLPRSALAAMAVNVAIDGILGSVPVAGDFFDTVFKANIRNLRIIEKHLGLDQTGFR